ncbi:MAG: hypothetical protein ACYDCD_12675 [Candidatus Acidiferrales bacterium]
MPFINRRFYANPVFGWGVELARILAGQQHQNPRGTGEVLDQRLQNIIGDVPSLGIYSAPLVSETNASDSASGFCDLKISSHPHGVKCEQGKDYHGMAVLVIAGVGKQFHYVDPDSIRVAAEAGSDIVSVDSRPMSILGGHQQWAVNFTIKSGPGFKQQGGGILWTIRYKCTGKELERRYPQILHCL